MRLLRVGPAGAERPAIVGPLGHTLDLSGVTEDFGADFFSTGGVERIARLTRADKLRLPQLDVGGLRAGSPIARPGKVVCIGLNYADHAAESGQPLPEEPIVFLKDPCTVVGPNDDVFIPRGSVKTDWEVELGVVIGATCRYLEDEAQASAAIAGYVVSHDVSEREFQLERGGQWDKGKSCETFNPVGPWLVTPDEVLRSDGLHLWLDVNGHRMQDGSTKSLIFSVPFIIRYLSQFMVLHPGDLINTGTPAGVGLGRSPAQYLRNGDVVELGIDGLGTQRQVFRRAD
jgi:2-keto-4-pentenoate hydratase/2-oxohepta-3-ene-1,7-dioic acid hydratase in catechol pathway